MIYHVIDKKTWDKEKENNFFGQSEIKQYGFIHSSNLKGLYKIVNRFTAEIENYLVLIIDESQLTDRIVYEEKDKEKIFPHFYELIDIKHIIEIITLAEFLKK